MTNHYFFGGRLHSPKPPRLSVFRLDVLGSSSDKSTVRACASIKSELIIWFRNFSYLPMKSFSTNGLASQGADSHIASRVVTFYPYNFQNLSHLTMTNSSHITMSESTQTTTVVSADITARKEYPNLELSTYKQLQGLLNLAMYQSKADVSLTMDFIQMLKTRNMEKAQWRKEHPIVNEVQSS